MGRKQVISKNHTGEEKNNFIMKARKTEAGIRGKSRPCPPGDFIFQRETGND